MLFHFLHKHFALKSIPFSFKINPKNLFSAVLGRVPTNAIFKFEKWATISYPTLAGGLDSAGQRTILAGQHIYIYFLV